MTDKRLDRKLQRLRTATRETETRKESISHNYKLAELESLPTLSVGQADDLKIDRDGVRVWLCRCGVADGMPYDNQVTVEHLTTYGDWRTVRHYQAK